MLHPGGTVWLFPVSPAPRAAKPRKTNYRAVLAELPRGGYATVDARVAELVGSWWLRCAYGRSSSEGLRIFRQVAHGAHRFDLYVPGVDGLPPLWVEVKSVTYVLEGIGYFPDAVTDRGRRHLLALAELAEAGQGALALSWWGGRTPTPSPPPRTSIRALPKLFAPHGGRACACAPFSPNRLRAACACWERFRCWRRAAPGSIVGERSRDV